MPDSSFEPSSSVLPAELLSEDGQTRFTLEVLRWEMGLLPCTRYDEWLIVRLELYTSAASRSVEGAFLLRFEVDEIRHAVQNASESLDVRFTSDFLEPILTFGLCPQDAQPATQVNITLMMPDEPTAPPLSGSLLLSPEKLAVFQAQLAAQLEGFPSRL